MDPNGKHHLENKTGESVKKLDKIENTIKTSYNLVHIEKLNCKEQSKHNIFTTTVWYAKTKYQTENNMDMIEYLEECQSKFKNGMTREIIKRINSFNVKKYKNKNSRIYGQLIISSCTETIYYSITIGMPGFTAARE